MKIQKLIAVLFVIFAVNIANSQKKYSIHTVAFYNFENLFDTINGPNNDEEWLPNGAQNWTSAKYNQKLKNLALVLSQIGTNDQQKSSPTIIGGAEIENRGVLEDLVKEPLLNNDGGYGIVHFDSPDKRGIDVALLYKKKNFQPTSFVNIPLLIYRNQINVTEKDKETEEDKADKDKIVVATDNSEEVNIMVNHWPSRSGGEKKSSPFREAAGRLAHKVMDSIYKVNPDAKIILMGDLNDGSYNKSVKIGVGAKLKRTEVKKFGMYNPFEQMAKDGIATLFYRDAGDIFDQIMVSETLITPNNDLYKYWKAGVYNKPFMIQMVGQYKGYPLRHQATEVGYSDHFPAYVYLLKEIK
jgi:hypothetical protein